VTVVPESPQLTVESTPRPNSQVALHIEAPASELDRAVSGALRRIARQVRVPGFRPGKAPPAVDFAELLNRDLPAPPTLDRADPLAGHLSARLGPTAGSVQPVPDRPAAPYWHLTDSPPPAEPAAGERPS